MKPNQPLILKALKVDPESACLALSVILSENAIDRRIRPYIEGILEGKTAIELATPFDVKPFVIYHSDKIWFYTPEFFDTFMQSWRFFSFSIVLINNGITRRDPNSYCDARKPEYFSFIEESDEFLVEWFEGLPSYQGITFNQTPSSFSVINCPECAYMQADAFVKFNNVTEYLASL